MKKLLAILATIIVSSAIGLFPLGQKALATINQSELIDNSIFLDTTTMDLSSSSSQTNIQLFLNAKGSGIASYVDPSVNQSAATIIYNAAQAYGVNPQVILATLQKEQALVTDSTTPSSNMRAINCAMGYDSCNSHNSFFSQVDAGTWQLRYNYEASSGRAWGGHTAAEYPCKNATTFYSAGLYPGNTVTFANSPGGSPRTILIANAATASLYCYTPYVGPYSDTGYSGSYNFVVNFNTWFGSSVGDLIRSANNATVYLADGSNKYPIAGAGIMTAYGTFGPVRFVNDTYLSSLTTGPTLGHIIGAVSDSSLYYVTASIKLGFTDCGQVADYGNGASCSPAIKLSDSLLNKLATGPHLTPLIKSPTNGTIYYMKGGSKRPIPSWTDLINLNISLSYNVLNDTDTSDYPTGDLMYGPSSLIKTASSGTVYVVKNTSELFTISSFSFPAELGITGGVRTMSDSALGNYTVASGLQNKIQCGSSNYVGIGGSLYLVPATMMGASYYNYNSVDFVAGGTLCTNLGASLAKSLVQYIRTPDGTVYYIGNSQKQAFTNYAAYVAHQTTDGNPGYVSSSDFFASTLATGTPISS